MAQALKASEQKLARSAAIFGASAGKCDRRSEPNPSQRAVADTSVISGSILGGYPELVEECGASCDTLLEKNRLIRSDCGNGDASIAFNDYAALLEMTSIYVNCPNFGMMLAGLQDCLSLMVNVHRALKNTLTIGDFFQCGARFMHTHTSGVQTRLEHYPDSNQTALRLEVLADGVPYRRQVIEHLLTVAHDCAVVLSGGQVRAREVWFAHGPVSPQSIYEKRLRTRVRFAEPFNGLLFNSEDLDFRIVARDDNVLRQELQTLRERFPYRPQFSFQVKSIIHRHLDQSDCSREAVAAMLDLNPRTLHRRLQREGTTFEAIREQVRRDLMVHYLAQSEIGIIEVAARLGYAEPAVLTRACRRWFGRSPKELRQSLTSRNLGVLNDHVFETIHSGL